MSALWDPLFLSDSSNHRVTNASRASSFDLCLCLLPQTGTRLPRFSANPTVLVESVSLGDLPKYPGH